MKPIPMCLMCFQPVETATMKCLHTNGKAIIFHPRCWDTAKDVAQWELMCRGKAADA